MRISDWSSDVCSSDLLSDALRRRCLYAYVDYPDAERERAIVLARLPHVEAELAGQAAQFVRALRAENLEKTPGIAETPDWVAALAGPGVRDVAADPERSEERRGGKECVSKCCSRWSPYH